MAFGFLVPNNLNRSSFVWIINFKPLNPYI